MSGSQSSPLKPQHTPDWAEAQMNAPVGTTVEQKQSLCDPQLGSHELGLLIWAAAFVALSVRLVATSGAA